MLGLPTESIDVDWAKIVTHMITIKGIYGREMYESWVAMSAMLQSSTWLREALSSVITDRFPITRWQEGFAAARAGTGGKVVLNWEEIHV